MKTNNLATYLRNFFQDYLPLQRGFSENTIASYGYTIKLLLTFAATHQKKSLINLTLTDLTPPLIIDFLNYLEKQRNNKGQTRNIRLASIHHFFRYVAAHEPLLFDQCHRIMIIPFKRTEEPTMDYLERDEMDAILQAIDRSNPDGYRDYALFTFMYDTGARVQEVISLPVKEIRLEKPIEVKFRGKGKKIRLCPLWPETVEPLRFLIKQRKLDPQADVPIFVNHRGQPLTRYGIRYLLNKYVQIAAKNCPSLERKRIHPHSLRHSCAMGLIKARVDINTIRAWLGHVTLITTNKYAKVPLDMMKETLENRTSVNKTKLPWKENKNIQWLDSFFSPMEIKESQKLMLRD